MPAVTEGSRSVSRLTLDVYSMISYFHSIPGGSHLGHRRLPKQPGEHGVNVRRTACLCTVHST
jgi:hypothetical protein